MIPAVRQWLITDENGHRWIVLAPTRKLARMDFSTYVGWVTILTLGVVRKQRTPPFVGARTWRDDG